MRKINPRKLLLCVRCEYVKWVSDARMIVFVALLVFVHSFVLQPLFSMAEKMSEKLSVFEPFTAVCNVQLIMLAIPLVFLVLISDYPRVDNNSVFFISRIGRLNWVLAQIMLMFTQVLSYIGCLFLFITGVSLTHCTWSTGWSSVAVNYLLIFPEEAGSFAGTLLTGQLYRQMLLSEALLQSAALMALLLLLIGMIQLLFSVLKLRRIGFIVSAGMVAVGQALAFINSDAAWLFPVAHALVRGHYSDYYRKPIMRIDVSYVYFGGIILVLMIVSICCIRKYNYDSILEVQ